MPSYKIIKVVNNRTRNLEERTLSKVHPDIHSARKHAEGLAEKMQSLPTVKSPGKWTSDKRNLRVAQKGGYATTYLIRPITKPAGKSSGRTVQQREVFYGPGEYRVTCKKGTSKYVKLFAPHTREQVVDVVRYEQYLECVPQTNLADVESIVPYARHAVKKRRAKALGGRVK